MHNKRFFYFNFSIFYECFPLLPSERITNLINYRDESRNLLLSLKQEKLFCLSLSLKKQEANGSLISTNQQPNVSVYMYSYGSFESTMS